MLDAMRKASKGWLAGILIFILVLSFGIWGVQDMLNLATTPTLASVAGERVTPDEFQREYNRLARLILRLEKRLADLKAARPPDRPPAGPEKETCTNEPEPIRTPSESALILVHSRPSPPPQTLTPTTAHSWPGERGRRLHSA